MDERDVICTQTEKAQTDPTTDNAQIVNAKSLRETEVRTPLEKLADSPHEDPLSGCAEDGSCRSRPNLPRAPLDISWLVARIDSMEAELNMLRSRVTQLENVERRRDRCARCEETASDPNCVDNVQNAKIELPEVHSVQKISEAKSKQSLESSPEMHREVRRLFRAIAPLPTKESIGDTVHHLVLDLQKRLRSRGQALPLRKLQPCVYTCSGKKLHLSVDDGQLVVKCGNWHIELMKFATRSKLLRDSTRVSSR